MKQAEDPAAAPVPQPDNGEQRLKLLERKEESCLALASDLWQPETVWNDIACYHPKVIKMRTNVLLKVKVNFYAGVDL